MTDRETESRVRELLSDTYPPDEMRFDDGFADRVLARTRTDAASRGDLTAALTRHCRRVIPVLLAASLALAAWNLTSSRGNNEQTTENYSLLQGAEAFQ